MIKVFHGVINIWQIHGLFHISGGFFYHFVHPLLTRAFVSQCITGFCFYLARLYRRISQNSNPSLWVLLRNLPPPPWSCSHLNPTNYPQSPRPWIHYCHVKLFTANCWADNENRSDQETTIRGLLVFIDNVNILHSLWWCSSIRSILTCSLCQSFTSLNYCCIYSTSFVCFGIVVSLPHLCKYEMPDSRWKYFQFYFT